MSRNNFLPDGIHAGRGGNIPGYFEGNTVFPNCLTEKDIQRRSHVHSQVTEKCLGLFFEECIGLEVYICCHLIYYVKLYMHIVNII